MGFNCIIKGIDLEFIETNILCGHIFLVEKQIDQKIKMLSGETPTSGRDNNN